MYSRNSYLSLNQNLIDRLGPTNKT